jgi:hypothetical protein
MLIIKYHKILLNSIQGDTEIAVEGGRGMGTPFSKEIPIRFKPKGLRRRRGVCGKNHRESVLSFR